MTGIYGAGRAFNLKYRPNGPAKVFITDRRPIFNFFGGCRGPQFGRGYDYMSSSTYVEYKPSFWDNLSSIIQSATGIFCMLGGAGLFNKKADGVEGKPKPQGATSNDDGKNLERLKTLAKGKGITIVPEDGGRFTLMKDDQNLIDADYKDAQNWILNFNSKKPTVETPTPVPKKEPEVKPAKDDDIGLAPKANDLIAYGAKGGKIDVIDDGTPTDILNKTTVIGKELNDKGYPKRVTINGGVYIFDEDKSKGGEIWYKSQFGKQQSYRLEQLNEKIVFIQHEGDSGYNIANTK